MAIAVIDSGLGGLSVVRALRQLAPSVPVNYVADNAWFPYGSKTAEELIRRSMVLVKAVEEVLKPSVVVIACNTLSTLALAQLRREFSLSFVGTVPAIKVAARISQTRRFTLLATPNTARSTYSDGLIDAFATDCIVDRYGAPHLAAMIEAHLLGAALDVGAVAAEIAPCFHDDVRGRTDAVVLGCTHYPLIAETLADASAWSITWVDASKAIARQALKMLEDKASAEQKKHGAWITSETDYDDYARLFAAEHLHSTALLSLPSTSLRSGEFGETVLMRG